MTAPSIADQIRSICNVGHGVEKTYAERYQRAIDAALAICEPHDQPRPPLSKWGRPGSPYNHGFTDGQRSIAGAIIHALAAALIEPDGDPHA